MIKQKRILLIGISDDTKTIIDIIEGQKEYIIFGLIDPIKKNIKQFCGYEILGSLKDLPHLMKEYHIFGGMITNGLNDERFKWVKEIKKRSVRFHFITVLHPDAIIGKNVSIDEGTFVGVGTVLNADAQIGKHCMISDNVVIGHDGVLKDFTSVASKTTIGGGTTLQAFVTILMGVNIIQKITIGEHAVIEAGSTVISNIADRKLAMGIPAKEIGFISTDKK